jgi:glycerol-3-phosphate dehydrogenase
MAEHIIDMIVKDFKEAGLKDFGTCKTKNMPISGGHVGGSSSLDAFVKTKTEQGMELGLTEMQAKHLASRYGSNADALFERVQSLNPLTETYGMPIHVLAEIDYAICEEMTAAPADFFVRRTGSVYFDINWAKTYNESVTNYMAEKLKWSPEQKQSHIEKLNVHLHDAVVPDEVRKAN